MRYVIYLSVISMLSPFGTTRAESLTAELQQQSLSQLAKDSLKWGDADRGKEVFHREKLGCVKCHIARKGSSTLRSVGPGLKTVADRLGVNQLIESILAPNASISKGYQSYIVLKTDGEVVSGVLATQTAKRVVLVDPDNGQVSIRSDDIESMQKAKSAMPDDVVNQLAGKEEFYDLVQYLASQKASNSGSPVVAEEQLIVREIALDNQPLSLLAIARPDGICYTYDPNQFRLGDIWQGQLGWQSTDGQLTLNEAAAESFHIRDKPWKIDVGRDSFDFEWGGYEIQGSSVAMRFQLISKADGRVWKVTESIDVPTLLQQRLRFRIEHPVGSNEVLTFWLHQTNFRRVATNGQQAQRNQLEFLKPGQREFFVDLARRRSGQTVPHGYSIAKLDGPQPEQPFLFEPTSFDFASDGTAFVSTRTGDIWRLHEDKWNLFADGLHETQGVHVADDGRAVYTMQKPELTRLEDTDSDGVADVYRSVANQFRFTGHYHEFSYGPVQNSSGAMFFSTGLSSSGNHEVAKSGTGQMSSALGYRGWMMKVDSKAKLSPFACGFRSPAGIGINQRDELFVTDNQGDWVASSYLGHVQEGDFMGHPASLWDRAEYGITPRQLDYRTVDARVETVPALEKAKFQKQRKRPAVWLIHGDLTNSPGNPSFCPTNGFGPFAGQAFIADISHRSIVRVALEKVGGVYQGAVFPFIRPLGSASYSTRFAPDGRLWVGSVGRGWTVGDPIIEVVSFDESKPPFEMQSIELAKSGFDVHFTRSLARDDLSIPQISVKQFHYLYWGEYGSDRQDLADIAISGLTLSDDRKTLHIELPLKRNKIYEIDLGAVHSDSGLELKNNFAFYTLNELVE